MFNLAAKESHRFIKNYVGGFFWLLTAISGNQDWKGQGLYNVVLPCNFISWNLQIKNPNQVNLCMHNTATKLSTLSIKVHLNKLR